MITGKQLKAAIIHAAILITNQRRSVDELNVYPVPDGDTGTNMSMTISAAKRELELLPDDATVSEVADVTASSMLRGARGNSGVITSLLFRGFSKGLAGLTTAENSDFANALELGVAGAYKAVMKPTEGTILTVSRMAANKAQELAKADLDAVTFWQGVLDEANAVLKQTTEMLPALKKANVVDAGGQGFCIIIGGMLDSFRGEPLPEEASSETKAAAPDPKLDFNAAVAQYDEEINFTYCTEYIIEKNDASVDGAKLRAYLETIGDCVVVVEDDEIIKVHVHTDAPGMALTKALEFGHFINEPKPKIENMRIQHAGKVKEAKIVKQQDFVPVEPTKDFGFVAVAAGGGLERTFLDLGVDQVVKGGQTMNPSTDDILKAIHATPARTVFVLPNNKNIIMAAEQAINLANRNVIVLQTRTIPQGIAAMLAYDESVDANENRTQMTKAFERVSSGSITFAARDSELDGQKIKKNEVLALDNGKLAFTEKDVNKAAYKLTKKMVKGDSSYVTVIYGADVTEDKAQMLYDQLCMKFKDKIEITLLHGGQPVYYYLISVE
ncbi:MAG: DAK2 domain-containing protein [Oscillospiraceae bacterium]|nr:DAK2 domain-containing protein [Oscillospiraceae bacterium]